MTQKESVLQLLNQSEWVCGREFLANYLQEYRTRINELRKDGFTVEARRCTQHQHKAGMQEWSLKVRETQNLPRQVYETPKASNYVDSSLAPQCCDLARARTGFHARGCETQRQAA